MSAIKTMKNISTNTNTFHGCRELVFNVHQRGNEYQSYNTLCISCETYLFFVFCKHVEYEIFVLFVSPHTGGIFILNIFFFYKVPYLTQFAFLIVCKLNIIHPSHEPCTHITQFKIFSYLCVFCFIKI